MKVAWRFLKVHNEFCTVIREQVVAWVLCAKRMGIIDDIRILIVKAVWETKKEGRKDLWANN